jgi:hypothetical protein
MKYIVQNITFNGFKKSIPCVLHETSRTINTKRPILFKGTFEECNAYVTMYELAGRQINTKFIANIPKTILLMHHLHEDGIIIYKS